jgi:hypothetical protein
MGTRSLTVFLDDEQSEIAVLYRQFDGYPSGHGKDLAEILAGVPVVNGFGNEQCFNGAHDLAVQVICALKARQINEALDHREHLAKGGFERLMDKSIGVGGLYLYPAKTRNMDEEYVYRVRPSRTEKGVEARISCDQMRNGNFMPASVFLKICEKIK